MELIDAIAGRHSVRGFRPDPVPRAVLAGVLATAQQAPSWCNIQPWRLWVTGGASTRALTEAMVAAANAGQIGPDFEWPKDYPEPYGTHRRQCGKVLYSAMGIARDDHAARAQAWLRNYQAFGAPHVVMIAMDRRFGLWAALDIGHWMQTFMLACVDAGLATCPQAALGSAPLATRQALGIPDELAILCGLSVGYEDTTHPANAARTSRAALADNVTWHGDFT
jgi:nitroreductase